MLNRVNLQQFIRQAQTYPENVMREYCQHLFLSYLYQQPGSGRLLFKGGTALRIVFHSPRYSEDLDFTGSHITQLEVEDLFTNTLANMEKTGIKLELKEGKATSGGYIGIATFHVYDENIDIRIEVSLRGGRPITGVRKLIDNEYVPVYSLVHLPGDLLVQGKLDALKARHKPRDFYDYFFLLSGNYPLVKEKQILQSVLKLINDSKISFHTELKRYLPASHSMHLRNFKKILIDKIKNYIS